jgi:hypothetical protein
MTEYFDRMNKPLGGYKLLTKEEALGELRKKFHKTRFTKDIYVEAEIIAALLGYNNGARE